MIIWGSGGGVCIAGDAGTRDCPVCQSAQRFDLTVSYRYAHIWYAFSWVTSRQYQAVCSRCHNGVALTKQEFQSRVSKDPIPAMRRRGWVLIPAIVGLVIVVGAFQEWRQGNDIAASIATPHAGDIYFADLSKVVKGFDQSPAYGALKLVSADGSTLTFVAAKTAYNQKRRVDSDLRSGKVGADDYFDRDELVTLSTDQLRQLQSSRVIYDVNHNANTSVSGNTKNTTGEPTTASATPTLAADYSRAVMQAVQTQWIRPDNTPATSCKVRVTQQPGGHITGVDVESDCPYDEAGKRSVVNAVRRADPLPYQGYEQAFQPTIVLTFASMYDASQPSSASSPLHARAAAQRNDESL
nr:cell envelope integrity protein TolA [Dyella sp. ASV24]